MQFKDFDMASASLGESVTLHYPSAPYQLLTWRRDTANELFWRHLFPRRRTSTEQPVFKVVLNTSARKQLGDVILRLVGHDWQKLGRLLESLNELVPFYAQTEGEEHLGNGARSFAKGVRQATRTTTLFLGSLIDPQRFALPAVMSAYGTCPTHAT